MSISRRQSRHRAPNGVQVAPVDRVESLHDLHVLLRHRLLREARGFEGFGLGRETLQTNDQSVAKPETSVSANSISEVTASPGCEDAGLDHDRMASDAAARRLEADHPAARRRTRIERPRRSPRQPAPWRGGHRGGRAAARAARADAVPPGIARGAVEPRLGGYRPAVLRRIRLADDDEAGRLDPPDDLAIRAAPDVAIQREALVSGAPLSSVPDLDEVGNAGKRCLARPSGGRRAADVAEFVDNRIEVGVELLDSRLWRFRRTHGVQPRRWRRARRGRARLVPHRSVEIIRCHAVPHRPAPSMVRYLKSFCNTVLFANAIAGAAGLLLHLRLAFWHGAGSLW